jgi:hypothetical protein
MSITIQCVQLATLCFFGFSFKNRDEKKNKEKKCKHTKQNRKKNGIEM